MNIISMQIWRHMLLLKCVIMLFHTTPTHSIYQLHNFVEVRRKKFKFTTVTSYSQNKSKGLPQQAEVAQGVLGRLRPQIFLMFRHYKGGRSSAKRIGHLYPRRNPWYSLSKAESSSGHMVLSGVPRKKIHMNRSWDLPTSSAVP